MSIKLNSYLDKIKSYKKFKIKPFFLLIEKMGISEDEVRKNLELVILDKGFGLVKHINTDFNNMLKTLSSNYSDDRISLAKQNKSHNVKVSASFLLLRKLDEHPIVVVIDKDSINYPKNTEDKRKNDLIVIENYENFYQIDKTLKFLREKCGILIDHDTDIIYGSGNSATNSMNKKFYDQYDNVKLFFDLDLAGLKMAKSIIKLTPELNHQFVIPESIDDYLQKITLTASSDAVNKSYLIGKDCLVLKEASEAIARNQRTFEQEGYLDE
jgi:5S rRNA maturation endonuclease (ribonuclease M5)